MQTEPEQAAEAPSHHRTVLLKKIVWILFAIGCLVFFTFLKLPQDRIRAYLQGAINDALANQGITLSAAQSSISMGLGISYTMKQVTLSFPPPKDPIRIDEITVAPSILSLLMGKIGGRAKIENRGGELIAHFALPAQPKLGSLPVNLELEADKMDLGGLGLLKIMTGVDGGATIDGTAEIKGDLDLPSSLSGQVQLKLAKVNVEAQSFMGFSIPHIAISDGKVDLSIAGGKLNLRSIQLGKASNPSDDIHANVTSNGDMNLGRTWAQSTISVRAEFGFSQNVVRAIPLIDALLAAGRQADGSYAYNISGPVSAPNFSPAK